MFCLLTQPYKWKWVSSLKNTKAVFRVTSNRPWQQTRQIFKSPGKQQFLYHNDLVKKEFQIQKQNSYYRIGWESKSPSMIPCGMLRWLQESWLMVSTCSGVLDVAVFDGPERRDWRLNYDRDVVISTKIDILYFY